MRAMSPVPRSPIPTGQHRNLNRTRRRSRRPSIGLQRHLPGSHCLRRLLTLINLITPHNRQLPRIITCTNLAFQTKPMVRPDRLRSTIITTHQRLCVSEPLGHRLAINIPVQIPKLCFHIHDCLRADWAFVGGLHVTVVAGAMDGVPAAHEDDGLRRIEHV